MICEIMAQNIELKCGKCAHTAIYYTTKHDLGGGIQGNSKKELLSFENLEDFKISWNTLTHKSKPPCTVDSTTEKYHSVTFIWIDTLNFDLFDLQTKKLEPPSIA